MSGEGVNSRLTKCPARGNGVNCPTKKNTIKNVDKDFLFCCIFLTCSAKSQNVRRGTHGTLDKMSNEAQNHFAYCEFLSLIRSA